LAFTLSFGKFWSAWQKNVRSAVALDSLGNSSSDESRSDQMKYWEIIADNLSKADWSWGLRLSD